MIAERKLARILSHFRGVLQSLVVVLSLISSWLEGKAVTGSCPAGEGWVGGRRSWRHLCPRGPRGLRFHRMNPPCWIGGLAFVFKRKGVCLGWGVGHSALLTYQWRGLVFTTIPIFSHSRTPSPIFLMLTVVWYLLTLPPPGVYDCF